MDGGPDARVTLAAVDRLLPYNDRAIDVALLSHAHADHLNGLLAMAERGRLERLVAPPPGAGGDDEDSWRGKLEDAGLELVRGSAGMTIALSDGVRLEVLHPPLSPNSGTSSDVNNNGLVVLVRYGRAAALLPGDLQAEGELVLLDSGAGLSAQVLKVGHHGSDTSSTEAFLQAVRPLAAVVSAGEGNPFGHPSAEVVAGCEPSCPRAPSIRPPRTAPSSSPPTVRAGG